MILVIGTIYTNNKDYVNLILFFFSGNVNSKEVSLFTCTCIDEVQLKLFTLLLLLS